MPRLVKCAKLGQELPGMAYKPFKNELGQRIYDSISQQAWMQWIEFSKRIVNEFRLDLGSEAGQKPLNSCPRRTHLDSWPTRREATTPVRFRVH
jgi:Fe-S cluster biosynthesis and repair protein YggX